MNILGTFTRLRSLSLLRHLSNCHDTTCLHVLSNSVTWLIYLEQGKIIYATHSIEPFDRLERHLRRLDHQLSALSTEIRVQVRLMFEADSPNLSGDSNSDKLPEQPAEYQAICWLVSQRHINPTQAAILIQEMVKEVLESFSLINTGNYKLISIVNKLPVICRIDTEKILEMCDQQLRGWQTLTPHISSPYQRPYLRVPTEVLKHQLSAIHQNLATWMKGFSLRHLAVIVNQDEVEMARQLYQYISSGEIVLHEPDPPFDKLPLITPDENQTANYVTEVVNNQLGSSAPSLNTTTNGTVTQRLTGSSNVIIPDKTQLYRDQQTVNQPVSETRAIAKPPSNTSAQATNRKVYKIVSVDDSATVLREISRFLEHENFSVVTINDPVKAVMSIIRNKPDLILLDLNMDGIDGYELCKIIRNNSMFKKTPIVMVTGNKGLVDKVKARLVGASGYLTKPFTQADLLKMVFMHLT
ncbi:MAG: response regulator [Calothrix sp. FI2-JRJ7]|jgi:twitching motility two-component system response regulator PilG|nr:response regulator [Calothrix sp. FI2-JRJ7]